MITLKDFIFYIALLIGIVIFLRMKRTIPIINRILLSCVAVIVLMIIFFSASIIIALIIILIAIIVLLSSLGSKKFSIFKR